MEAIGKHIDRTGRMWYRYEPHWTTRAITAAMITNIYGPQESDRDSAVELSEIWADALHQLVIISNGTSAIITHHMNPYHHSSLSKPPLTNHILIPTIPSQCWLISAITIRSFTMRPPTLPLSHARCANNWGAPPDGLKGWTPSHICLAGPQLVYQQQWFTNHRNYCCGNDWWPLPITNRNWESKYDYIWLMSSHGAWLIVVVMVFIQQRPSILMLGGRFVINLPVAASVNKVWMVGVSCDSPRASNELQSQ